MTIEKIQLLCIQNHPLHNLSNKANSVSDSISTLRDLPYKQLKEITQKLANPDKE
jgi:hypothetical protein